MQAHAAGARRFDICTATVSNCNGNRGSMSTAPGIIIHSDPPRGNMRQHRFAEAVAFTCRRCAISKKSKLVATVDDDWSHTLCNGCYGLLLSKM